MRRYLYIISCNEYTKIGISDNVERRASDITTNNPYPIKVVASFEIGNAEVAESFLHKKYSQYRTNREWFVLSDSQIAEAISLCQEWQKNGPPSPTNVFEIRLNHGGARRVAAFLKSIGYANMTVIKCLYLSPVDIVNNLKGDSDLLHQIARAAKLQP
jgi:hypothetical protein